MVLAGRFLYVFASPKDKNPETHFWVNNSEITDLDE